MKKWIEGMMKNKVVLFFTFFLGLSMGIIGTFSVSQAQPSVSLVTGIGGVFFKSEDPEALRTWYAQNLGIRSTGQGVNFFWRETGDPDQYGMTVWSLFPRDSDYFGSTEQQVMVNYRVSDLDALLAELATKGIRPVKAREDYEYGSFSWIEDAEGNRIELWQPAAMDENLYRQLNQ